MKQDRYFKYLAAALTAGVVLAFVNPAPSAAPVKPARTPLVTAAATAKVSTKS